MLNITNPSTLTELEANLRNSEKTATVNGETYRIYSDQNGLRSTFALRECDGRMECLRSSGYIHKDLTVRKAIAESYGLPTFRKEKAEEEPVLITDFFIEPQLPEAPVESPLIEEQKPRKHREGTKQDKVLQMLKEGTTIAKIMNATGWKEPSARGILYRLFKKEMGLELVSELNEYHERVYRVIL